MFTYDPTKLDVELNELRLRIGDVDENDPLLEDEEIQHVQDTETSFYKRASECCKLICSKIARRVKTKIGSFSEDANDMYIRYRNMAEEFAQLASSDYPWAASISKSDKETYSYRGNDDVVRPRFEKGLHSYLKDTDDDARA